MRYYFLPTLMLLAFFSSTAFAVDKPNQFELSHSLGIIDSSDNPDLYELNDIDTAHINVNYLYNFSENLAIGGGYLSGDSSKSVSFFELFTDSRIEYEATHIDLRLTMPLGEINGLYLNFGALSYDIDFIDDDQVFERDSGVDFMAGIGWSIKFNFGLGMRAGYEYLSLGSDTTLRGITYGLSYSF